MTRRSVFTNTVQTLKVQFVIHLTGIFLFLYLSGSLVAQPLSTVAQLTHADTLRGTYGASRNWWNVLHYDLHVRFDIAGKTLQGYNDIRIQVLKTGHKLQLDLQAPMELDSLLLNTGKQWKILQFQKDGNAYFFEDAAFKPGKKLLIRAVYHGKPKQANRPPWDGGLIWSKDEQKNPFVSVACQGLGASVWYPCKDHQADEPDSAMMHITVPDTLTCVGNGRLRSVQQEADQVKTWTWAVTVPINNYNLIPYIGKYIHFQEQYPGLNGPLDVDYWTIAGHETKARKQFEQVPRMLKAFEYWFGPYPFYKDGYKLVEAPHLGMEHQSAVAYGNRFMNGYMGSDLSGTGWGLKWDFIIVHESGHEWFANNITTKDIADMWVHEGFTCYSETLFTDYYFGKDAATDYICGIRKNVENDMPIIGPYNVNKEGSGDMYYKAANMIHTIRMVMNNDSLFRKMLIALNLELGLKTVTGKQVEQFINRFSGKDFSKIFDQYLRTVQIPELEYRVQGNTLEYRYQHCVKGFNLPVRVSADPEKIAYTWIIPGPHWKKLILPPGTDGSRFKVDRNFYVNTKNSN